MHCVRERLLGNKLFLRLAFDLPDGCHGTCEGIIAKDSSLIVGRTDLPQEYE
jgi:hypothetical protein